MSSADNGRDLFDSMTIPSDSENYDANNELSDEPESSSSGSPMILYSPPTMWGLLRGAAINLLLPFVNGLMLGFGELFANELAFRFGWSGTKVRLLLFIVHVPVVILVILLTRCRSSQTTVGSVRVLI